MHKHNSKRALKKLWNSKKALAIPITYLALFVSLMMIISVTYSFAVVKIGARGALLRASVAKQNMLTLDDTLGSVAWSFGASKTVYMDDCGGSFEIQPKTNDLVINVTDGKNFHDIVFRSTVGKVFYEFDPSEFSYDSSFIRGDRRAIVNKSSLSMTQLYVTTGIKAKELVLRYRPSAISTVIKANNGKPENLIRIYIKNLNSSQSVILQEKFYLKVNSENVTSTVYQYEFNQSISSLALKAVLDGTLSTVWLPISSNSDGAVVNLEIVVCNIKIHRVEV